MKTSPFCIPPTYPDLTSKATQCNQHILVHRSTVARMGQTDATLHTKLVNPPLSDLTLCHHNTSCSLRQAMSMKQ